MPVGIGFVTSYAGDAGEENELGRENLMSLRAHLASIGDWEPAIVELPECREYPELQQWVFANAYFSKQSKKVKGQC